MTPNTELIGKAKDALSGKWLLAIGTCLVYMIVVGASQAIPFVGAFIGLVVGGPFVLGLILFSRSVLHNSEPRLEQIFDGFKNFGTAIATYLLSAVAIIVGFILLIIPGIILALGLSMSMYIIADDEEIGAYDALKKSWDLMDGFKVKYLGLVLLFVGLSFLCILTLGIGFLFLIPLMQVTMVAFYEDVKRAKAGNGGDAAAPAVESAEGAA